MYIANTIKDSWIGLIGWRQNYNVSGKMLEEAITQSESGMYYQDEHPMLTLDNLQQIMPDYSRVNYPNWDNSTAYLKDQIVKVGGVNYKALRNNTNQAPSTSSDDWKVFNQFSEWLVQKTKAGILDTVIAFLEKKEMVKTAKTILENKTLFDGIGKISNTVDNNNRRVGFEIVNSRSKGLNTRIDRIGVQLDTNATLSVYLHHSSKETPLKTLNLVYVKAKSIQWFDLAWDLPNVTNDTDAGGAYYITYKQSQLDAANTKAIKKEKEWNTAPCESCVSASEVRTWKQYSRHVEFNPFTVPEVAGDNLWDITDNRYDNSTNHGINFAISIYCDYTDFLVKQRDLFKSVLRKQVAINLLRELAYNPNSRITQDNNRATKEQILYEIDGDTRGRKTGLAYKYKLALEAITLNTEGLHRVCLPCKRKGVRYKSMT